MSIEFVKHIEEFEKVLKERLIEHMAVLDPSVIRALAETYVHMRVKEDYENMLARNRIR
jgi:hypothetical protein